MPRGFAARWSIATGTRALPPSPPGRYAARRGSSSFTRLARLADLATSSGSTPHARGSAFTWPARLRPGPRHDGYARGLRRTLRAPPSPGRHESALGVIATPGATPHAEGSAFTQPTRLGLGHDCYARGLHRMLGAPPSPGRHDSALGITAMPGGYTSRRGLCLQPADTTRPWARLLRPGAAPHAGGSAFTRSARLRPRQDYCAGGLRRMLGAPPAPVSRPDKFIPN
uniref:Uncharacterized protein n=1 Tax=Oryza rufipogon TaxID=4529 RepID=A0A0E0NE39_ORYRU